MRRCRDSCRELRFLNSSKRNAEKKNFPHFLTNGNSLNEFSPLSRSTSQFIPRKSFAFAQGYLIARHNVSLARFLHYLRCFTRLTFFPFSLMWIITLEGLELKAASQACCAGKASALPSRETRRKKENRGGGREEEDNSARKRFYSLVAANMATLTSNVGRYPDL